MLSRSAKPRLISSTTPAPRCSSRALVATVVPRRTSCTRPSGTGWPGARPSTAPIAFTAGSPGQSACTDSTLRTTSSPAGLQPTTSVKVPPRSIQNRQPGVGQAGCTGSAVILKLERHLHVLGLEQVDGLLQVVLVLASDPQAVALDRDGDLLELVPHGFA